MATISILAILIGIAVPSFQSSTRKADISSQSSAITAAVNIARSEAIKRGINISICPNKAGICSGATDWSTGWIVFTDNSGVTGDLDDTDVALQVSQAPANGMTFTATAKDSSDNDVSTVNSLTFNSTGELTSFPGGASYIQFGVSKSGCGQNELRLTSVRTNGRISVSKTDCP